MTDDHSAPRLEEQLCFAIYAAEHAFSAAYRPLLDPLGLTYPQYLVLMQLWVEDGRSVGKLGDGLHLDSGTLTPLLKRMEAAGLVTRRRDPKDERVVLIHLTPKGDQLRAKGRDVRDAIGLAIALPPEELAVLRTTLTMLAARLRNGRAFRCCAPPPPGPPAPSGTPSAAS